MDEPLISPPALNDAQPGAEVIPAPIQSPIPPLMLAGSKPAINLWTSGQIFWLGFFTGWPGGFTLAVLDWFRIGRTRKGLVFLGFGLLWLVLYSILIFVSQDSSRLPWFILNVLVLLILKSAMDKDIPALDGFSYQRASSWKGFFIALGVMLVYLGIIIVFAFAISFLQLLFQPDPLLPGGGLNG